MIDIEWQSMSETGWVTVAVIVAVAVARVDAIVEVEWQGSKQRHR